MAANDKAFFVELGKRIAQARKDHGMTQQQLAEELGIAQQTLAHYEGARLRVPASLLPQLAAILGVPVEALIGQPVKRAAKRGPAPKLQQHMERISQLPKPKQKFVMEMLETVLAQQSR
jgi:transcriptional regulator with XRE-family HTH domain